VCRLRPPHEVLMRSLDDQHTLFQVLLHGKPERELRADVVFPPRAEPSGQPAGLPTQVVIAIAEAPD